MSHTPLPLLRATLLALVALVVPAAADANAAPAAGEAIDGIRCDRAEGAVFHIHQHVAVFDHGRAVPIPSDVGRPLVTPCLYWLHTHTPDGLVHVESPKFRTFTLGNFFAIWGEPLTSTAVGSTTVKRGQLRVFVDGRPYRGDPRKIDLSQHTDIVLEAGPPYVKPVPFTDWQGQ
ncbi:MAG: hypothetical protein NVS2B8_00400 [Vulcanimicrobiaceae bacterium]